MAIPMLIIGIFVCCCASQDSRPDIDESQEALLKALTTKFGKRPSGHSFVRFGKRTDNKGHSYMYFGKRAVPADSNIADLLQYLQRSQEPSWKRGHSIMRFGKRSDRHNFIRFGKRDIADITPDNEGDTEDKRDGHSMMYFGKRGGHSMLYFGKRIPYSYEDNDKKGGQGHSMMYFGKRSPLMDYDYEKRGQGGQGHSMMYFGKRSFDGDKDNKKSGHSMMYFGKREPYIYGNMDRFPDEGVDVDADKRGPHSMIHFGKRYDDTNNGGNGNDKQAHSMIYFGKRFGDTYDSLSNFTNDDEKRAGHGMIHFGKREDPYSIADNKWNYAVGPFDLIKNSHYGGLFKSDESENPEKKDNKKSHMMIHFGKRSVESNRMLNDDSSINQKDTGKLKLQPAHVEKNSSGEKSAKKIRTKREVEPSGVPLLSFSPFIPGYDNIEPSEENYSNYGYEFSLGPNSIVPVRNARSDISPEKSKNVFLRFGKR